MPGGQFDERVSDLIRDAEAMATRGDWAAVRSLAGAALALVPDHGDAQRLLQAADTAVPAAGARRQLTVMFADVVGSTALTQEQDPEVLSDVLRRYQATCDEGVRRYEGRIARYVGDGVLAYFGHPVAHEDDARRAVQAGLDLLADLEPVVEDLRSRYGLDLRIRVAVHTGLVVLADMGTAATPDRGAIVGETPNLAARLQDHAAPGTVVISEATYQLVRPWFLVAPLGELELRGITAPVRAYQVVSEAREGAVAGPTRTGAPLVGRDAELAELWSAWEEAASGGSVRRAVVGTAGIGKSRLLDALRRRVEATGATTLITGCSSMHHTTALYPARRLVERMAGIEPRLDPDVALPRLWELMDGVGQAHHLPLVADLLELPATDWCPAPELDGLERRERLLGAIVDWVGAASEAGPVLLAVEDLHWVDPSTAELLQRLHRACPPNLLVVVTARDEAKVPWPDGVLALEPLPKDDLRTLAERLPEVALLAPEDLERAISRSDGVPLFLEELVRAGAVPTPSVDRGTAIPPALRDLLLARYAAPGVDLRLAQLLATIGTEAPLPLIAAASPLAADDLDGALGALVDAAIVELVPGDPALYRFRHHLLGELAYDTQLAAARRTSHLAVAGALLDGLGGGATAGPAVLAHHLERGGRPEEAVRALVAAAETAHGLGANPEVAELLSRAETLLDAVSPERRAEAEFEVRLLRGINAASQLGYAAPQAVEDFTRARDLIEELSERGTLDGTADRTHVTTELVWAASGLWATLLLQGRIDDADGVNRSLLARLDPASPMHAAFEGCLAFGDLFRGGYRTAEPVLRRGVEAFGGLVVSNRLALPSDPGPAMRSHLAYALAAMGRPSEAWTQLHTGLDEARAGAFPRGPFTVCYIDCLAAGIGFMLGDVETARAYAGDAAALAERHGFTFWSIVSGHHLAAVALHDGEDDAVARAEGAIAMLRAIGVLVWLPSLAGAVAELRLVHGDRAGAAAMVREAVDLADATGAHFWTAELFRLQGELAEDPTVADAHLRRAVDLATTQGARLFELRARAALVRRTDDPAERAALAAVAADLEPEGRALRNELERALAVLDHP